MITTIKYNNDECLISSTYEDDHIIRYINKYKKFYELKLLEKIKSLSVVGDYIDIGSNIGNHTIFFSKFCKANKVYSIEIDSNIFSILQKNIEINNISNVDLLNIGISDKKGFAKVSKIDEKNIGKTKIIPGDGEIKVEKLDTLFENKKIDLIKIDVEGHEYEVLLGASNILTSCKPILIIECQYSFEKVNDFLKNIGYETDGFNYSSTPTFIWKTK
jgi:FkbM family methyltransferase